MKRIFLILLLALATGAVFSQEQTLFADKNYDNSFAVSKTEKKPLIIMFYAKWCPHCNVMKKEVFTDSTVTAFYRKNFVMMGVDAESTYGKELKAKFKEKFSVISFPTFVFLDNDETLLYCTSGEFKKDRFLSEGNNALLPENQIPNLKEAFRNDPSNADKCLKYITTIKKAGFDTTKIAQKYLSTIKPEDKFTEMNWRVFANGISSFDNDEFKFVIDNKEAFSKAISAPRIEKKIVYTVLETLRPLVETADTINYNKKRSIAETFRIRKIDSLLYRSDLQILSQTNNWKKYQKVTSDNVEKFSWKDTNVLYDVCNTYYETINDKKSLLQAADWSQHLLTLKESNDNYVVAAKLLLKLKDYKQAAEVAQKGKAFVDGLGFKADEINALLEQIKKHT